MDREQLHRIRKYTFRSELDKALHSLEGLLKLSPLTERLAQRDRRIEAMGQTSL